MLELYQNIKRFRLDQNMTQDELARKTGYTDRSSIAKIERGDVDLPQSKIFLFARALGVTPGELMGNSGITSETAPRQIEQHLQAVQILFGNESPEEKKIRELLGKLTEEEKQELLNYIKYIISKRQ